MSATNFVNNKKWDAIIIGTGFGGSMAAYQLTRAGLKVLLLERGNWVARDDSAWDPKSILIQRIHKSPSHFESPTWAGRGDVYPDSAVGGNSIFYGAASLRLRENDFRAASTFKDLGPTSLSHVDWPLSYAELEPDYEEAERLLHVSGDAERDPCAPPRNAPYPQRPEPYSIPAERLVRAGEKLDLRPFPLPLAINYDSSKEQPACRKCQTCDLFPCKICAKNDLTVRILPDILKNGGTIRPATIAKKLIKQGNRITGVECVDATTGETFKLSCSLCIVSSGAIGSTQLLLLSGLSHSKWNGNLVGRYLLRHCNGIVIGMFPFQTNPDQEFNKQVAFTDFYYGNPGGSGLPGPWGMLQALQVPPAEYIQSQAPFPIGNIGAATTKYHSYLLCIAEDLPNKDNRIELHPGRKDKFGIPIPNILSVYDKRDILARRALYREAARILKTAGATIRLQKPINTWSHAIGGCRFGSSPENAVLDPNCTFFGIPNLFVVDGSFMPTSGGVNPSLTIAANALRVGRYIAKNSERILRD